MTELEDLRNRAEAGDVEAQCTLGRLYQDGDGVPRSYREAVWWYRRAAEQGHGVAQLDLAKGYEEGVGVPQDDLRAYMWANLGAANARKSSRDEAVAVRDRVAKLLSPQKRLEAQDLARQFLEGDSSNAPKSPGQPATPDRRAIPRDVKTAVWQRDGGHCVECGSKENLEYDYIIPVSKGGSNTERNIQLLCESCNRSKGASI